MTKRERKFIKKNKIKHIICYSGGHSSAIAAIEVTRRYGKKNVILVNHECKLEEGDVSRFEKQIANYLGIAITYVNFDGYATKDQFDVVIEKKSFVNVNSPAREALCTTIMKTAPFMKWLSENFPEGKNCIIYYGFDASEGKRIQRRSSIMAVHGYQTGFPLIWKERTIQETSEIGIERPNSYNVFKHANCVGCLKAGWQHWYCVYVLYPEVYEKAILAEDKIGYKIHRDFYLDEMKEKFDKMIAVGIEPTEHIKPQTFWADVKKKLKCFEDVDLNQEAKPCECFI